MMMQQGEPVFCVTSNPSDVYSPLVMSYGGHDIKSFIDMQRTDARFCYEPKNRCGRRCCFVDILSRNYSSGIRPCAESGALGKVQAYIGMTEEHSRLTLHAHLMVWVCGYSGRDQLREDLGTSLVKHAALAKHVGRIIRNQLMSTEVACCRMDGSAPVYSSTDIVQQSSNNVGECGGHTDDWPEDEVTRNAREDKIQ